MEAFSLLKYWRGGGGGDSGVNSKPASTILTSPTAAEIQNDNNNIENDNDNDNEDDDGPFFDLEFSVDEDDDGDEEKSTKSEGEEEGEREFKFSTDDGDTALVSSTGDLFFKGKLVTVESPSSSSDNQKPQFPVSSLLKSATKLRVFMLNGLKKPPSSKTTTTTTAQSTNDVDSAPTTTAKKLFTVKFKVKEVPIVSLFTRDNSSRSGDSSAKSREVVQRYLKKVKPLYVRVSRRHAGAPAAVVPAEAVTPASSRRRRDDSLIQQQDGIQSAILHCKRSFNASTDSEGSLLLSSDPSNEKKCLDLSRKSSDGIQRA